MRWRGRFPRRFSLYAWLVLPGAKAAQKRIRIVAGATSGGQHVEVFHIASAEHHVVGFERSDEARDDVRDTLSPLLLAV
jgi:hypothetical protein